jgi:hypothetical protein
MKSVDHQWELPARDHVGDLGVERSAGLTKASGRRRQPNGSSAAFS